MAIEPDVQASAVVDQLQHVWRQANSLVIQGKPFRIPPCIQQRQSTEREDIYVLGAQLGRLLEGLYSIRILEKATLRQPQVFIGLNELVVGLCGGFEVLDRLDPLLPLRQDRSLAIVGFGMLRPQRNGVVKVPQSLI
ncbi:hypothetical protein D3C71_879860 [compost metagenome]